MYMGCIRGWQLTLSVRYRAYTLWGGATEAGTILEQDTEVYGQLVPHLCVSTLQVISNQLQLTQLPKFASVQRHTTQVYLASMQRCPPHMCEPCDAPQQVSHHHDAQGRVACLPDGRRVRPICDQLRVVPQQLEGWVRSSALIPSLLDHYDQRLSHKVSACAVDAPAAVHVRA